MADIRDRLKKLAGLVRHDEEALSTCEDAIKEFDRLMPAGNAGAAAGAVAHSWYRGVTFSTPPPPSQTTQVKMEDIIRLCVPDADIVEQSVMDMMVYGAAFTRMWIDHNGDVQVSRICPTDI